MINSVALSRAKKRDAVPLGVVRPTAAAGPIPAPPTQNGVASSLTSTGSGSFRKSCTAAPLPSIPSGHVSQVSFVSPKTGKLAMQLGSVEVHDPRSYAAPARSDDSADDDIDGMLKDIDCSGATATDSMDRLTQEERQEVTQIFGNRLTPEIMRDQTGFEDLHLVTCTQLVLNTKTTAGVEQLGEWMPKLTTLRLNHSYIPSFRDLGSKWGSLQVLYLSNAHVKDLAGIVHCKSLRELYVAFNFISTTSDILTLSGVLEVLDLEGNRISEPDDIEALGCIEHLRCLSLAGNPVATQWNTIRRHKMGEKDPGGEEMESAFEAFVAQCIPSLRTLDDVPIQTFTSRDSKPANAFVDPNRRDLAAELQILQASIRSNVDVTSGLEGSIETRHRYLNSRQSTSCGGARRRTPASQSGGRAAPPHVTPSSAIPQSTPRVDATQHSRSHVNSAPDSLGLGASHPLSSPSKQQQQLNKAAAAGSPSKGGHHTPPPPSSTGSSIFNRSAFLTASATTAAPSIHEAKDSSSSLTSGGAMFSGNLVKSLRRRLPSLPGAAARAPSVSDEALASLNRALLSGSDAPGSRTLREQELMERLAEMRVTHERGADPSNEASTALQALLDELDLEMVDFQFAMGGEDDALEVMKREEFLNYDEDAERPKLLDKYRYLLESDEGSTRGNASTLADASSTPEDLSEAEIVKEVAKLKLRTLRDANAAMVENPQEFESLQMSDLGGDLDGVL